MTRKNLGEFEQQVLLASLRIKGDVYAVPVAEEIEKATRSPVSHAAVYIAMQRLEKRGLVESRLGDPSGSQGGKRRRLYTVTDQAIQLLAETRRAYESLWSGLNPDQMLKERSQ